MAAAWRSTSKCMQYNASLESGGGVRNNIIYTIRIPLYSYRKHLWVRRYYLWPDVTFIYFLENRKTKKQASVQEYHGQSSARPTLNYIRYPDDRPVPGSFYLFRSRDSGPCFITWHSPRSVNSSDVTRAITNKNKYRYKHTS